MPVMKKFLLRKILKPLGYNLKQYEYRSFMKALKNTRKKGLVGVEIGTLDGWHALEMMELLPIKKLYLIDPYRAYKDYDESVKNPRKTQKALDERMKVAKKVLEKYGNKVQFIRKFSDDAADLIKDNSLDFIYIDGNHQYEFVKSDLKNYYKKVKKGGFFGGHDYTNSQLTILENFGVFKAVNEFIKQEPIYFHELDWWVIKGEEKKPKRKIVKRKKLPSR
jgi:hypothetical protein|tara:strand:+ start:508 stop:1170 length:663 start_codon:yes stop_codon:yes gene_type:complete